MTKVSYPATLGPPARVIESRIRSPAATAGSTAGLFTSPNMVTSDVRWSTKDTTACGSIALFLSASTIACWTCVGVQALCADVACVWHRNVAIVVDSLIWNRDEVAGAHARFGRNEQPTRSRLEYRYAHDVADAELKVSRRTPMREGI